MYQPPPIKPQAIRLKRIEHVVGKVQGMSLSSIRKIMRLFIRQPDITPNHLLPEFGMTLGEFCVGYVVKEKQQQ